MLTVFCNLKGALIYDKQKIYTKQIIHCISTFLENESSVHIAFVTMVTRSSPRYERLSPRSGSMTLSRACSAGGKDQTEWCLRSVLTRRGTGTWCFGSGCVSIRSFYLLFMAKKVNASLRRPFYCLRHKNVTA